ncbi:hypothetical protein BJ944DRAFT_242579 [Cunninghamella echinulata]|nr:hypothetical protein BJ944DRAFT_242579 [Cunninghamella echinulata]
MITSTQTSLPTIITLHDAITDSPIYRASTKRFDLQIDSFIEWFEDLSIQTKSYAEKLKKLNEETIALASKLSPATKVDEFLIDPLTTGKVVDNFAETLKTNLTFKTKMVSDLEDHLIQPIDQFVKTNLREFKEFRTQHELALKEYENDLEKYSTSDINNDGHSDILQQLDTSRKTYTKLSGEHAIRIFKLRSEIEQCMIQQFSATSATRKEFYDDAQIWKKLNAMLFSWNQWLLDSKETCKYELKKQQVALKSLENEYLSLIEQNQHSILANGKSKYGYLFTKNVKESTWKRSWTFIHDGYFGYCHVRPTDKGADVTIEYCLPLTICQAKPVIDSERHYCFELTNITDQTDSVMLQAETEQCMGNWIKMINKVKKADYGSSKSKKVRPTSISVLGSYDFNDHSQPRSPALLIPKSKSTTIVSTPTDIPVTLSTNATSNISGYSNGSNLSSSPGTIHSIAESQTSSITTSSVIKSAIQKYSNDDYPSLLMTTTSQGEDAKLSTATSLTFLVLCEITNNLHTTEYSNSNNGGVFYDMDSNNNSNSNNNNNNNRTWGTPRSVISNDILLIHHHQHKQQQQQQPQSKNNEIVFNTNYSELHGKIVWPLQMKDPNLSTADINGYTSYLNDKNKELRHLFYGVSPNEVVMDVFTGFLHKKVNTNMTSSNKGNGSHYKYSGYGYITQETLWFYSNLSINCINTIALKLKNIEIVETMSDSGFNIRLIDDTNTSLHFSVQIEDVEAIVEKLRFLIYNAKLASPMQLRNAFRKIISLSSMPLLDSSSFSSSNGNASSPLTLATITSSMTSMNIDSDTTVSSSNGMISPPLSRSPQQLQSSPSSPLPSSPPSQQPRIPEPIKKAYVDPDALPAHIEKPTEPIQCECEDHLDKLDVELELPISAKRLYELMFTDEKNAPPTDGGVWNAKTEAIEGHDLRVTPWELSNMDSGDQQMMRMLKYWMPVANPIVRMKEAEVEETQILLKKQDYLCYVIQISTKTPALPYADAFIPSVKYCITYINDSRCKLTCHIGVRWVKYVMVKAIVTRAALKGMSDSIGVFIPILENVSKSIEENVNELRRIESEQCNTGINSNSNHQQRNLNENILHITTTMDNTIKKEHILSSPTDVKIMSDVNPLNLNIKSHHFNHINQPIPIKPALTSSSSPSPKLPISSINKPSSSSIESTPKKGPSSTKTTKVQFIKEKLTDDLGQEIPSLVKTAMDSLWPPNLWIVGILIIGCSIWLSGIFGKHHQLQEDQFQQQQQSSAQVIHHAIYLRDLDEGFIKKSLKPPYAESKSFKVFIHTKNEDENYLWYDGRHYQLALEYNHSRQQLAILRHNMVNMFQTLNMVDSYLMENEYLNWLLDHRQRCRGELQQPQYNETNFCEQINLQIGTYF